MFTLIGGGDKHSVVGGELESKQWVRRVVWFCSGGGRRWSEVEGREQCPVLFLNLQMGWGFSWARIWIGFVLLIGSVWFK